LGALLLGAYRGKDLTFVGKVGTGFSQETLAASRKRSDYWFTTARLSLISLEKRR
jgi:ATP-dependent DNA ligase